MKIRIWGARGSTPAPVKPEVIQDKIAAAMLGLADLEDNQRQELIALLSAAAPDGGFQSDEERQAFHKKRRQAVEQYMANHLSPLVAGTAGSNTPCIEIRSDDDLFIIDAGSGIRELGIELMQGPCGRGEGVIHLLFSHPHWDHIQGFPFFRPAFIPGNNIFIYSVHDIETALRRQQEFISFPISLDYMQATKTFVPLEPEEVLEFGDLRIRNICNHHPGDSYSFRFEKGNKAFVYACDASYPEGTDIRPYLNFFNEADVLIFDAQFTQRESDEKEDWGHSSSFVGVEMAQQAQVKNLALFHYDPTYTDENLEKILDDSLKFQQNQYPTASPVNIVIAQEGLTFDLRSSQSTQVQQVPGSKVTILKPAGIFDEQMATKFREQVVEMIRQDQLSQIVIDMAKVEMLQVAGLRGLVKLRKEQPGIPMALAAPSSSVQQLIELVGYLGFFAIYPSVHVALNALKARETLHLPGQILKNRYKIKRKIGDGRLGTVFTATDTQEDKVVAIKILSPSFSEAAIEQFLRQARQIVNLAHPNIVEVYDCDEDRGLSFMAEELFESRTLQAAIDQNQSRPLPFDQALSIAQSIVQALEYAHGHDDVVHGDLKPENVLLAGGQVKISDFGLGRLEGGKALISIDVPPAFISARYLAPEQILDQPIDARTDLYALGAILYEIFTGTPVFEGTEQEIVEFHRSQSPTPPRQLNPNLSRSLEHLILKLLEKDPNNRYTTARQVRHLLGSMAIPISRGPYAHNFTLRRQPALVGRQSIIDQLTGLWTETEQGRGQVVLLTGAPGTGKSRVAHELACQLRTATVLIGDFPNMEGCPPYYAFIRALETYFRNTPPDVAAENVGYVWRAATQVMPELVNIAPALTLPDDAALPPANGGLARALADVTSRYPWLMILDDLQWADTGSLKILAYLANLSLTMPLMIVGICEDDGPPRRTDRLSRALARLRQQSNCTQILVEPLPYAEIEHLLAGIWPPAAPETLVTAIHNQTGGNPLFAETLAFNLIDEGVVKWENNGWHFGPVIEMNLPRQIEDAVRQRIAHLSRETQTLLSQAAVLGPVFRYRDLHELSDLSAWDALESIDIALERQLLQIAPGESIIHFSHPLIQRVLLEGLSSLKQRLIHREAGEAMERQHLSQPNEAAGCLSYHFYNAGEFERGLNYSIQAAEQARAMHVNSQAIFWYSRALDTLDQFDVDQMWQEQRFQLLLARAQLHHLQGVRRMEQADLSTLQRLAQALKDPNKQAAVHHQQAQYEYVVSHIEDSETEARAGLIAARQASNPVLEGESLVQLATVALHRGEFDRAREHLYAAQQALTNSDSQPVEARRLSGLGTLYECLDDYTESEHYYQQAVELCEAANDRQGLVSYLNKLGKLFLQTGRYTRALVCHQQAVSLARIVGHAQATAGGLNGLGNVYRILGDFGTARHYLEEAKTIHHQIEHEQGLANDLQGLGTVYLATSDYVAARDYLGQALEIFQRSKNRPMEHATWLSLALALEGLGHISKAIHAYEQAKGGATQMESRAGIPDARAGLARCFLAQGQAAEALAEIEDVQRMLASDAPSWRAKDPIRLYLTIYWVLQSNKNATQALAALRRGYGWLQTQAEAIDDPQLKRSFLENVPENMEVLTQIKLHKEEAAANNK